MGHKSLTIGSYTVSANLVEGRVEFFLEKGEKLWAVGASVYGTGAVLSHLQNYKPNRGTAFPQRQIFLEIDLLRHYIERVLYAKGVRVVSAGVVRGVIAGYLESKGWVRSECSLGLDKSLSPRSNPKPLLLERLRSEKRKARHSTPRARLRRTPRK